MWFYTFEEPAVRESSPAKPDVAEEMGDAAVFARRWLGFEPDEMQTAVLRSESRRGVLNCSRQWGKSTVAAAKAIHRAYTREGSLVLVSSPSERQSAEFLDKAKEFLAPLGIAARGDGHNRVSLLLPNRSRIVGLPGAEATVRGFSRVSLLLIDEAARVEDRVFNALTPMLANGDGDLWLMSTPCGRRGFFYEAWEHGGPEWARFSARATECARISPRFLEEQRRRMTPAWFGQEFLGEFVDNETGSFSRETVERAVDAYVKPLDVRGWEGLR